MRKLYSNEGEDRCLGATASESKERAGERSCAGRELLYRPAKKRAAAPTAPAATHWTPKLAAAPVKVEGLALVGVVALRAAVALLTATVAAVDLGAWGWPSVIWETATTEVGAWGWPSEMTETTAADVFMVVEAAAAAVVVVVFTVVDDAAAVEVVVVLTVVDDAAADELVALALALEAPTVRVTPALAHSC